MPEQPMTHVGFSGTRAGMTDAQARSVGFLLQDYGCLHHGDCEGADRQAHDMAVAGGLETELHPPLSQALRAFCVADRCRPPKDHLARNRDIVDAVVMLIAAPLRDMEDLRSGTWATVRYARKVGVPVCVVLPNGDVQR